MGKWMGSIMGQRTCGAGEGSEGGRVKKNLPLRDFINNLCC